MHKRKQRDRKYSKDYYKVYKVAITSTKQQRVVCDI